MTRKLLFVVIHTFDSRTSISEAKKAFANGADGIFLINHLQRYQQLITIYKNVRKAFPNKWIGLNFLDLEPDEFCEILPQGVDAVWADDPCIDEILEYQEYALRVHTKLKEMNTLYFGGTAFKYQPAVNDLETIVRSSSAYMDVITTSGPKTGIAPDVEKIKKMAKFAHECGKELAIASGITVDNVDLFRDADSFLVATGISQNFYVLDPVKLKALSEKIHKL